MLRSLFKWHTHSCFHVLACQSFAQKEKKKKDFKVPGCGTVSSQNVWRLVWSQQVYQNAVYRHKTITFLFKASMTCITVKCPLGHKHLVSPGSPLENVNIWAASDSRPLSDGPKPTNAGLIFSSCFHWQDRDQIKSGSPAWWAHTHAHRDFNSPAHVCMYMESWMSVLPSLDS